MQNNLFFPKDNKIDDVILDLYTPQKFIWLKPEVKIIIITPTIEGGNDNLYESAAGVWYS